MIRRILLALAVASLLATQPCSAQAPGPLPAHASVLARLRDGSTLVGRIGDQTTDSVQVTTTTGQFTIARSAIRELRLLTASEIQRGGYWPEDPHDTRLFLGPTGRTLAANSGYFSDTYVLLFSAAYGITDRLTIGGGLSVVPVSNFFRDNDYYVAPKFALVRSNTFNLAVGAMVGFSGYAPGTASLYYVVGTSGRPDASLTYGLGYTNASGTVNNAPTAIFGGNKRVARRVAIMSENYLFFSHGRIAWAPLYGVRFIGDRLSTDLGIANYAGHTNDHVFPGVPWLGFAIPF